MASETVRSDDDDVGKKGQGQVPVEKQSDAGGGLDSDSTGSLGGGEGEGGRRVKFVEPKTDGAPSDSGTASEDEKSSIVLGSMDSSPEGLRDQASQSGEKSGGVEKVTRFQPSERGEGGKVGQSDDTDAKVAAAAAAGGDSQVVEALEERAVANSPDGRFLKFDIEIGRGSFKTVYKGLDTETGVAVAWCELQENRYNKAEQMRFKDEVAILKTLQHPNILKLYDSWEVTRVVDKKKERKLLILITELMTSGTLKSYMRRLKSIKPKMIRSWGRQILRGLHFLHTRTPPIIHRDLKCDNIFINGTTGLVKIGDLGLATLKRSDVKTVIGTPEFMAPEMYEENYDEQVDVYAFGMCLLEMCTQEYPYMECTNPAQIYKRVTQGIRPHAVEKVKVPVLGDIIRNCITPQKHERFTVRYLLDHEFFAEGVKVEVIPEPKDATRLKLRMEVPSKDNRSNGQESIEFAYNLGADEPEKIVGEMVTRGILRSEDQNYVSRSIVETLEAYQLKKPQKEDGKEKDREREKEKEKEKLGEPAPIPDTLEVEISHQLLRQTSTEGNEGEVPPVESSGTQSSEGTGGALPGEKSRPTQSAIPTSLPTQDAPTQKKSEKPPSPVQNPQQSLSQAPSTVASPPTSTVPPAVSGPEQKATVLSLSAPEEPKVVAKTTPEDQPQAPTVPVEHDNLKSSSESSLVAESAVPDSQAPPPQPATDEPQPLITQPEAMTGDVKPGGSAERSTKLSIFPSQSQQDSQLPAVNGTGKKKPVRGKGKLRLSFLEVFGNKDKVVKCSLVTSGGQMVYFQFSMEYDKPQEIFQKFVKARHLTQGDQEEFIQQAERLIEAAKKGWTPHPQPPKEQKDTDQKPPGRVEQSATAGEVVIKPPPTNTSESTPGSPTEKPELAKSAESIAVSTAAVTEPHVKPTGSPSVTKVKPTEAPRKTADSKSVEPSQLAAALGESKLESSPPPVRSGSFKEPNPPKTSSTAFTTQLSGEHSPPPSHSKDVPPPLTTAPSLHQPQPQPVSSTEVKRPVEPPHLTPLLASQALSVTEMPPISTVPYTMTPSRYTPTPDMMLSQPQLLPQVPTMTSSTATWPSQAHLTYCPVTNISYFQPAAQDSRVGYVAFPKIQQTPVLPQMGLEATSTQSLPPPSRASRARFEIEDVTEADSPPELSAHDSTESLNSETVTPVPPDTSDLTYPKVPAFQAAGLQSASASSIELEHPHPPPEGAPLSAPVGLVHFPHQYGQTYTGVDLTQRGYLEEVSRQRSSSVPTEASAVAPPLTGIQVMPTVPETGYRTSSVPEMSADADAFAGVSANFTPAAAAAFATSQHGLQPLPSVPGVEFSQVPLQQTQLLTDAFARFLYAMNMMLHDPSMMPVLQMLDSRFGTQPLQTPQQQPPPPQSTTPTSMHGSPRLSPVETTRLSQTPMNPEEEQRDPEYQELLASFDEQQKRLDESRRQAVEKFKRRKGSYPLTSTHSKAESQAHLSHSDGYKAQSPPLVRAPPPHHSSSAAVNAGLARNVKLSEYQELPRTVTPQPMHSPPPVNNEEINKMERRVKESLFEELTSQSSSSLIGPMVVEQPHPSQARPTGQTVFTTSTSWERRSRQQNPQSQGGARKPIAPQHQSVPPQQHNHHVLRSDSSEWTEYTCAPLTNSTEGPHVPTNGTAQPGIATNRTVVSEFDPYSGKL